MSESKFNFYEIVRICTEEKKYREVYGKEAFVCGKVQDDKDGVWYYVVSLIDSGFTVSLCEHHIESLGRFSKAEDHSTGESVKVYVDENGRGYLKDKDN